MITTKINTYTVRMFLKMSRTVFTDHKFTYLDFVCLHWCFKKENTKSNANCQSVMDTIDKDKLLPYHVDTK